MDFHSLTRRELQSLCKLNKIPANITNVAMADALQALEIVKGIEEFMVVSKPETADLVESVDKVEASSPKAPTTRCRTTTRQKVKIMEPENLPPAAARSNRRGNKQSAGEVEESKNEILKTPAVSTSRRKAPGTLSCRNVSSQLNECEKEAKEEGKLQTRCSTRRSTRLTEKKSTEPRVKKESEKAVKIDSFDEVNIESEEVNVIPVNTVGSEVEEICDAFEKLDVVIMNGEEKQDFGELKQELTNTTSNPSEDAMVVEEGDVNSVFEEVVDEAKEECGEIDILKKELANETSISTSNPCEDEMVVEEGDVNLVLEEVVDEATEDCSEIDILKKESANETSNPCKDEMVVEEGDVNSVLEEVVDEAKEDCGEIDILKKESANETSITTSNSCEGEMAGEEGDVNSVLEEVLEEAKEDCCEIEKESTFETSNPCEDEIAVEEGHVTPVLEVVVDEAKEDCGEIDILKKELRNEASIICENGDLEEKLKMGEKDDAKPESDGISSPFEFQNLEEKLDIEEAVSGDNLIAVSDISNPFEDDNLDQKINLEDKTFNASEAENSSEVPNQENDSDFLLDNNASLESGAEDSLGSTELPHKDENLEHFDGSEGNNLCAVKEQIQVPEINGSSIDMVIDNTEMPVVMEEESENTIDIIPAVDLKLEDHFTDTIDNEKAGEITNVTDNTEMPIVMDEESKNKAVDPKQEEHFTEMPIVMEEESKAVEKPEEHFTETTHNEKAVEVTNVSKERGEFRVPAAPCFFKKATPLKNMSIVSDDKENIDSARKLQIGFVDEGKNITKEEKNESAKPTNLNEISIRQLKKQLKLLTLKNNSSIDASKEGTTPRPALQVLCGNQLVGGEPKN